MADEQSSAAGAGEQTTNNLIETQDTSVKWYDEEPGARVTREIREFYSTYTGILEDELLPHLRSIHKRAWDIRPYPCIGAWNFLPCFSTYMPAYPKVLERVKKGATFLDTGCCLGQDLRKMVANGALSTHMYGCDIADGFWELGYELFQDNDTLQAKFMLADIFDLDSSLKTLRGSVDILYLGAVLHLFSWQEQVDALVALVPLSKVGSTMFGFGVGWVNGREFETKWKNATKSMFYHDNETMQVMWQKVSKASGTKWEVKADLWKMERFFIVSQDWDWLGPDARMSLFEAMRVE